MIASWGNGGTCLEKRVGEDVVARIILGGRGQYASQQRAPSLEELSVERLEGILRAVMPLPMEKERLQAGYSIAVTTAMNIRLALLGTRLLNGSAWMGTHFLAEMVVEEIA